MTKPSITNFLLTVAATLVALMAPGLAQAGESHLFFVGGETQNGWTAVKIVTDDAGNLQSLKVGGAVISSASIQSDGGAVIPVEGVDRPVMKIKGQSLNLSSGGDLLLTYLHDGITGKWDHLNLSIHRDATGAWKVFKRGNTSPMRSLYFTKNTFFGKTIGIDEVRIASGSRNVVDSSEPGRNSEALGMLAPVSNGADPRVADALEPEPLPALNIQGGQAAPGSQDSTARAI